MNKPRIPPPVLALICAGLMWGVSNYFSAMNFILPAKWLIAGVFMATGLLIDLISIKGFWTARTTINPIKIENTSALVTGGLYRFTRNPMYLGMALILTGLAIGLANPLSAVGLVMFIALMNALQIKPEEAVLAEKFGQDYLDYKLRVRRWI